MAPTARSGSSWQSKQCSVDPLRLPRNQANHCALILLLTGFFHGWVSGSDGHCLAKLNDDGASYKYGSVRLQKDDFLGCSRRSLLT